MTGKSILLIDDDVGMLRRLSAAFVKAGYKVSAATDGLIGMKQFEAARPDLVLTDLLMPSQEGIETILEMKKVQPDLKVIAMSGGGRIGPQGCLDLALGLGADQAIAKPFRLADVVLLVESMLTTPPSASERA
jgi:DNA-binding NtrC family response regulator